MPLVIHVIVRSNRSKVKNFLVDFDFGVDTYIAMFVAPRELLKLLWLSILAEIYFNVINFSIEGVEVSICAYN